jgi:predicted Rossmann fold flavoprotein
VKNTSTAVIGGGAAGISAAISSARRGESVIICEKTPQLGKKILASGNGRCNFLNEKFNESFYNRAAQGLVESILAQFGKREVLDFFSNLGLEVYSQGDRIFPITNQAASVLRVLEMEITRLSVPVNFSFDCSNISMSPNHFQLTSRDGRSIECRKVIITGGGKTYPAYGSDGSTFELARKLGHQIIPPVPSVVPLLVKDRLCQILQGQRIISEARTIVDNKEGVKVNGELLFTRFGLSGTCILDVSEEISIAMNRHHKTNVFVSIDFVPSMGFEFLRNELEKRKRGHWSAEDMLVGILPNKIASALKTIFEKNDIPSAISFLKDWRFRISGTRGWNEAEFTSGGIDVSEVHSGTLESKLVKGIYFAGEVLDVNGKRGGYNLGWAWASGYVAGKA